MDIIQSFYYSQNSERQDEIETTLANNLSKMHINNIHLFIEKKDQELFIKSAFSTHDHYNKIKIVECDAQPKYPDLFRYGSNLPDTICCICNSDIEISIDTENVSLLERLRDTKCVFFLSRHECDMSCPNITNYQGSHDACIFHSTVIRNSINDTDYEFINYIQNTSGIEALITLLFIETLRYEMLNPCYQIKLIHHHASAIRLWEPLQNGHTVIVGYTAPRPLNRRWGRYNKHMIRPCTL